MTWRRSRGTGKKVMGLHIELCHVSLHAMFGREQV